MNFQSVQAQKLTWGGLTDSEIAEAFEKVKSDPSFNTYPNRNDQLETAYSLPQYQKALSFWSRLNTFSSSFIIIAVALYGLHYFYKLYIEPWLFGTKPPKSKAAILETQIKELNASISQLKDAVVMLEGTVNSQMQLINRVFLADNSAYMPIPMAISDVKSEISSVKSLLINRHQFPAIPKVCTPSIPLWQLRDSESENSKSEFKKEEENEEGLTSKTTSVENREKTENHSQDENFNSVPLKVSEDKNGELIAETSDIESDSQDDSSNSDETNEST
ncbi:peroxisomal membrane protein PEX14 [Trichonephila clavipes]|nr:peroxisomal membrane protein PEX14 [Trichonephila clavipes]